MNTLECHFYVLDQHLEFKHYFQLLTVNLLSEWKLIPFNQLQGGNRMKQNRMRGTLNSLLRMTARMMWPSDSESNFDMVVGLRRGENGSAWRKTSRSKDGSQQLNPHVAPSTEINPHVTPSTEINPHVTPISEINPHVTPSTEINPHMTSSTEINPHVTPSTEINPDHIDGKHVFLPLRHPCSFSWV